MDEIVKVGTEIEHTITIQADQNPAIAYITRLGTTNSRYGMRWVLNLAASVLSNGTHDLVTLDWTKLRYQHLAALMSKLISPNPTDKRAKPYSFGTVNMIVSGVKGVMKEAWKMELIPDSVYLRINAVEGLKGESLPAGRALTQGEIKKLFDACRTKNGNVCGARDTALLAVLLGAGLRRSEVVDLDYEDWKKEDQILVVRNGKGRRAREIPIGTKVDKAIIRWVKERGTDEGPLFSTVHFRSDRIFQRRLRAAAVYSILERRCEEAKIENVSPHDCRRTYITNLLANGNDLLTTAKLAGHKSVETTKIYDRRGIESLREAAESISLPC